MCMFACVFAFLSNTFRRGDLAIISPHTNSGDFYEREQAKGERVRCESAPHAHTYTNRHTRAHAHELTHTDIITHTHTHT
jgi:hypothetical protein